MAIDYTRRDFNTIKTDLLNRASTVMPEWTDRDPSDFGMLFVDLWAYVADVLHYYIDRANRESFLSTATRRESVLAFANLLDYVPNGRTAATAQVTITNSSTADSFTLPQYTALRGSTDTENVACYLASAITIPPNSSRVVDVYEGTLISEDSFDGSLGVSTGVASQKFSIPNANVVYNSVKLFVYEDGFTKTEYRRVQSINDALFGERVFATYTDATGVTQVLLGTNINGFIPPVNSRLVVRYATSSGGDGNYGANVINAFTDSVSGFLNVTASSSFVGGTDEESIDSLRTSIPLASRPQDRVVTRQDFIDTTLSVAGVYKAYALHTAASTGTNSSVTVYPVPVQSDYLTTTATSITVPTALQTDVLDVLTPRALLGVTPIVATSITVLPVNIAANVYVNERYVAQWVIADVQAALSKLFEFDAVSFGQRITLSDIHRTIVDVEGVDYAEIDPTKLGTFNYGNNTSTTSINVTSASVPYSQAFTVAAGLGFTVGQTIVAYSPINNAQASANYVNYLLGTVTSYSGTTLTVQVTQKSGSGTQNSWEIRSVSQTIKAGENQLFRKGDITLYSYGGITTSA